MRQIRFLVIYLIFSAARVQCDGDHAHAHAHDETAGSAAATSTSSSDTPSSSPSGTFTSIHTTSGDTGGQHDAFSSILSSLPPQLISSLARNPQVANALKSSGVDLGSSTAAKAAAEAGGRVQGPTPDGRSGAYNYPPPPGGPLGGGGLGGLGGLPFLPFLGGPYKNFHVSGDFGFAYPIVEKVIVIVGGGILVLLILAFLAKAFAKGGLFSGIGSSISEAFSGAASVDLGPFHKSVAGAGAVNAGVGGGRHFAPTPANMQMTQRVYDGIDQTF